MNLVRITCTGDDGGQKARSAPALEPDVLGQPLVRESGPARSAAALAELSSGQVSSRANASLKRLAYTWLYAS